VTTGVRVSCYVFLICRFVRFCLRLCRKVKSSSRFKDIACFEMHAMLYTILPQYSCNTHAILTICYTNEILTRYSHNTYTILTQY